MQIRCKLVVVVAFSIRKRSVLVLVLVSARLIFALPPFLFETACGRDVHFCFFGSLSRFHSTGLCSEFWCWG